MVGCQVCLGFDVYQLECEHVVNGVGRELFERQRCDMCVQCVQCVKAPVYLYTGTQICFIVVTIYVIFFNLYAFILLTSTLVPGILQLQAGQLQLPKHLPIAIAITPTRTNCNCNYSNPHQL